jgi:hypothetical protein
MKFEVTKKQRGNNGQYFSYPARRFATEQEAVEYAERFATDQAGVPGTKIVVTQRKGQKLMKSYICG